MIDEPHYLLGKAEIIKWLKEYTPIYAPKNWLVKNIKTMRLAGVVIQISGRMRRTNGQVLRNRMIWTWPNLLRGYISKQSSIIEQTKETDHEYPYKGEITK